ncbi:MAG: sulfur carrier protein ThiS [Halopseudomonas yangmingensis]|uniref:Sulfur carrier protein n=1 Tax=Halopseudomonas yangmingensis TaxID=1720063 RepID=A0A1I4U1T2_9GAMM|nr:sulfur carrier protein ThiS [Halopseudomonas yangmingensis]SFM82885.1 sulfur carrier protein [Halopseudomonas yangmingensis]
MQILLNGQPHNLSQPMTLAELLEQLGLAGKRLAVEHNLEIVPRSRYAELQLSEGDRLEIVHAIGGG